MLLWQLRDRVRPGVVFALYLVLSGLERFLVEFIRRNNEVFVGLTAPAAREHRAVARSVLPWLALLLRGAAASTALLAGARSHAADGAGVSRPPAADRARPR